MVTNPAYRTARKILGSSSALKVFFRYPAVKQSLDHPWAAAIVAALGLLMLGLKPDLAWLVIIGSLFMFSICRGEYKAALGSVIVGALAPLAFMLVKAISAILPVVAIGAVVLFYCSYTNKPPKVDLSEESKAKFRGLRR